MRCPLDTLELARTIVNTLEEKKGEDILLLDIQHLTPIADYFIICTATSDRMLRALAESVWEKAASLPTDWRRQEGRPEDGWMVLDYGSIIVHLLTQDLRRYYHLEEVWSEGRVILRLQ